MTSALLFVLLFAFMLIGMPIAVALGLSSVIAIMLVGRFLLRPLLRQALRTGSRDLIMALTLLILVAAAVVTGLAGLSVALGAFLAGLLLSESEARHHIEVDLEPFKGLLLGIFFITVGTRLDPVAIVHDLGWILLAVAALLAGKTAVMYVIARAFGMSRGLSLELGLLLAQAGEFAFVVLGVAGAKGLLEPRLTTGTVAVVGLSMLATPLLALAGRRLAVRVKQPESTKHAPTPEVGELADHVVIGGFGRVGQIIAVALEAEQIPYVAVDTNSERVTQFRAEGKPVYFGDASRPELLERVGGANARAFVVTLANQSVAERMVAAARKNSRSALIFARAADASHAARMVKRGAIGVIPETVEASLQLAGRLLETLDLPDEAVLRRVNEMREAEIARLDRAELAT
jgi:CPA2 family monovalent cation:H+ antiporter-2